MTNRNPVKQLFITFPHSNVDKCTFRDDLLVFDPEYYKVCEEKHKDGSPHLHAVIKFKNKYSKSHVLKKFKEKYPEDYKRIDVKPVRSIKNSIAYLSKEDDNPLESKTPYTESRNPQHNFLNQFARELGYNSAVHLRESHEIEQKLYNQQEQEILEFIAVHYKIFGSEPDMSDVPNNIFLIYRDLINPIKFPILKDDMTKLYNYLKKDLQLTRERDF